MTQDDLKKVIAEFLELVRQIGELRDEIQSAGKNANTFGGEDLKVFEDRVAVLEKRVTFLEQLSPQSR